MFRAFRIALFDYDRTLYPHAYPMTGESELSYEDECFLMLMGQKKRYETDKPLECMKWACNILRENGAVLYVLTHEIFNLRDAHKRETALVDYGIENYLTVNTPEHKIDMIRAVAKMHNVRLDQCLFVDDQIKLIYEACKAGICGKHISNIYQLYEGYIHGTYIDKQRGSN